MRQVVLQSTVSLSTSYITSLGTYMSNKVGRLLLGRSTVTVRNLLSSFSRILRSVLLLHSTSTALFARFLSLLTPSFNAFGIRGFLYQIFGLVRGCVWVSRLDYQPQCWGGPPLGYTTGWSFFCQYDSVPGDVDSSSLYLGALSFSATDHKFSVVSVFSSVHSK